MRDAERAWIICVNRAKKAYGIDPKTYFLLKGKLLRHAQKLYCAMGF